MAILASKDFTVAKKVDYQWGQEYNAYPTGLA